MRYMMMSRAFKSEVVPLSEVPCEHPSTAAELRRPILLVVDDEPLVADTLTHIFQRAGYSVLTAYDGAKALEIAQACSPDLLVSDVHMPGMNGVELAMSVVELAPGCGVVLCSGYATWEDLAVARAAGHDFPLMVKPVHPKELLKQVSASLSGGTAAVMPDAGVAWGVMADAA